MTIEALTRIDPATQLHQDIFGNRVTLCALISGGEAEKKVILERIAGEAEGLDPFGQRCFLKALFGDMAKEGNANVTDRRDAALEVLISREMKPIISANQATVYNAYLDAVRKQTNENEPFSGSIKTLFDAGWAIAPILFTQPQARQQITDEWEKVADQFPAKSDEQLRINLELRKIEKQASQLVFDSEVEQLRKQGFPNAEIAEKLGCKKLDVIRSVARLLEAGRIKLYETGRPVTEAVVQRYKDVQQLIALGLTNDQIAEKLKISPELVRKATHYLIGVGAIKPQKTGRKPKNPDS